MIFYDDRINEEIKSNCFPLPHMRVLLNQYFNLYNI